MDPSLSHRSQNLPHRQPTRLFLTIVLLWCALPLSPSSVDSDFWGHVQYGWDTWHHGLARTATYTYNAVGYPWINHENLAEIVFAWGAHRLGVESLLVLKLALGLSVLLLGMRHSLRQGVHPLVIAGVCIIASVNLSFYWGLRPHLFTFAFFGWLIALTEWCFDGWAGNWHGPRRPSHGLHRLPANFDDRRLPWLTLGVALMLIWTNTHGGFLAGVAVFCVLLSSRLGELILNGQASRRRTAWLVGLIFATLAVTLMNPYGIELHRWLFTSLGVPRPEIQEWHPPDLWGPHAGRLWLMLSVFAVALLGSARPRDLTRCIVLAVVASQACKHQRHLPFVAILFLFWAPVHLESALKRLAVWPKLNARPWNEWSPAIRRSFIMASLALAVLFTARVLPRLRNVPVPRDEYPVAALQYMSDQGLTGRVVVSGHWAQYVLGVMGARQPDQEGLQVSFDGRFRTCYPQQVVDLHFDFFLGDGGPDKRYRSSSSPPADPKRILAQNSPDLVLIQRTHDLANRVLQAESQTWVMLYQDELASVWGRRTRFDQPTSSDYLPPDRRMLAVLPQQGTVSWPAAPVGWPDREDPRGRPDRSSGTRYVKFENRNEAP